MYSHTKLAQFLLLYYFSVACCVSKVGKSSYRFDFDAYSTDPDENGLSGENFTQARLKNLSVDVLPELGLLITRDMYEEFELAKV
jgi:hypothetical protein